MTIPDFKRRNIKKNSARLWEPNIVTPQDMTRHLVAINGGLSTPAKKAANRGGRFYISMEEFKPLGHTTDTSIHDEFMNLRRNWADELAGLVREDTNLTVECPWCGAENGFNMTILGILAEGTSSGISEEAFACNACLKLVGYPGLWHKSSLRNSTSYPDGMIRSIVEMFAYPVKMEDGTIHGMPFHKGLYKNAKWRQSEHWSKSVGKVGRKAVAEYIAGTSIFDSEADMQRYLYIPVSASGGDGYLVRPFRNDIPIGEKLRMLGAIWERKYIYLGLANGERVTRRGKYVSAFHSLLVRPTAKHKKYIVIRPTQHPPLFEWMENLE